MPNVLSEAGIDVSRLTILYEENKITLFQLTVPRRDTFEIWNKLHGLSERTSYLPVILGDELQLEHFRHTMTLYQRSDESSHFSIETILEDAFVLDTNEWLASESRNVTFQHIAWPAEVGAKDDQEWRVPRYYRSDLTIALLMHEVGLLMQAFLFKLLLYG